MTGVTRAAGVACLMRLAPAGSVAAALVVAGCAIPHWPVDAPLTSPFGLRWEGGPDLHRGVDLRVDEGTPIQAMTHGRVRFAGTMSGFGNVVWLDHPGEAITVYAHLSRIDVATGDAISGGNVIGLSGQSGNATGPHLHFEIWRRGREVDPVIALGGWPSRDSRPSPNPRP